MQPSYNPRPVSPRLVAVLCVAYLLIGLLDHDMWKYEDAVHIGVAWSMVTGGDWLHPQLAGEAWPGMPLFHWLAALCGQVFGHLLDFHNAARIATALFGALALYAVGRASANNLAAMRRDQYTPASPVRVDAVAPLLLLGSPGLLIPMHEAQPMIAVLAGHALVYWGLIQLPHKVHAPLTLAAGIIMTLLAGGLNALLPLAPLLLLPLAATWRTGMSLRGWAIAAVIAGAACAAILGWRDGGALDLESQAPFSRRHFEFLAWFVWPMLPLAVWSLWSQRRHLFRSYLFLPLLGSIGSLLLFLTYGEPRILPALPVLLPLTLLAASGIGRLRRGAANAFDWFAMMTFTLASALVWLGAVAITSGMPPKVHKNIARLVPGFDGEISLFAWLCAGAITLLWLVMIFRTRRSPWRGTKHWACGTLLMWALFAILFMPLADYAKRYTNVTSGIAKVMGKNDGTRCLAAQNVGDAQRAALHYHTGIVAKRGKAGQQCDWLLVQSTPKRGAEPGEGWQKVWEGARPGDKGERFYLFKR